MKSGKNSDEINHQQTQSEEYLYQSNLVKTASVHLNKTDFDYLKHSVLDWNHDVMSISLLIVEAIFL
jgi:hypothetical protein